jgi:hypothetical protein
MVLYPSSGNGNFTKKLLWENSSPTSNFSKQIVSLSDDITNYDYILVVWNSATTTVTKFQTIVSIDQLTTFVNGFAISIIGSIQFGGDSYARRMERLTSYTSKQIYIESSFTYNTLTESNSIIIPISIYGIKGEIAKL